MATQTSHQQNQKGGSLDRSLNLLKKVSTVKMSRFKIDFRGILTRRKTNAESLHIFSEQQ